MKNLQVFQNTETQFHIFADTHTKASKALGILNTYGLQAERYYHNPDNSEAAAWFTVKVDPDAPREHLEWLSATVWGWIPDTSGMRLARTNRRRNRSR